jgi:hypothetical protein
MRSRAIRESVRTCDDGPGRDALPRDPRICVDARRRTRGREPRSRAIRVSVWTCDDGRAKARPYHKDYGNRNRSLAGQFNGYLALSLNLFAGADDHKDQSTRNGCDAKQHE